MALSSMGALLIMSILVLQGVVQGGRPGYPEFWNKADEQMEKGQQTAFDPPLFNSYKADGKLGKGQEAAFDPPLFNSYKADGKSGKGEEAAFDRPLFNSYKADGKSGKGEEAAFDRPLFNSYKADGKSGKGEEAAFDRPLFNSYKADGKSGKAATSHNADKTVCEAFLKTDLVDGATFRWAGRPSMGNRAFLPKSVADELPPLTAGSFPKLQRFFNIQEGSYMYAATKFATVACDQSQNLPGEERICATSFESFLDGVSSLVGTDVKVLTNSPWPRIDMGPLKVNNFTRHSGLNGQNVVCHTVVFPSLLYMCHMVPDTEVVEASLTDADGLEIRATGVCHLDTKMWAPEHPCFKILGVKPGAIVCHWLDSAELVWVSTKVKESSVIHEAIPHGEHMAMDMP